MDSQSLGTVIRRLREVAAQSADSDLLRAFSTSQDAAAFAEVVRRHGPMVLGVCRRVLRESSDADDAFQATFLVLFRKAGTLRRPERLAGWLHQVALRTSKKLRGIRDRRLGRQRELFDVPAGDSPAEFIWRELRPIFDEELNRLPDKLRLPAVLCFLEGCSKSEAARVLGWPEGTLAGRLQRAREWLRSRFTARGLVLSSGALAVALFDAAGPVAVAEGLIESTILNTTAQTAASAGVRALAEGVTHAMFLTKMKAFAATVLITGAVGTGAGLVLAPGSGTVPVVAGEPGKESPKTPPAERGKDSKGESGKNVAFTERDLLLTELDMLKERLAWQERMVKKGYSTHSETLKIKTDLARVEAALAKLDAPKGRDSKRNELDDTVKSLQRTVLEDTIKQLERNLQLTEDAFKKGIAAETEVIAARVKLNEYKLKLLELADAPARDTRPTEPPSYLAELRKILANKETALTRAEQLLKQKVVSMEEVRKLRRDVARLKAEVAEVAGDYETAVKHREEVLVEFRQIVDDTRKLVERKITSQGELHEIEIAFAEAVIERLRTDIRKQLADIVAIRDRELKQAKTLFDAKAIPSEEMRRAESALSEAKARLAAGR